jgi:hypothetical protein
MVCSAYSKDFKAKVVRAYCVISDTLCSYANGRKDCWGQQLPLAAFALNNAASILGDGLTPLSIDCGGRAPSPAASSDHSRPRASLALRAADARAGGDVALALVGGEAGAQGEQHCDQVLLCTCSAASVRPPTFGRATARAARPASSCG